MIAARCGHDVELMSRPSLRSSADAVLVGPHRKVAEANGYVSAEDDDAIRGEVGRVDQNGAGGHVFDDVGDDGMQRHGRQALGEFLQLGRGVPVAPAMVGAQLIGRKSSLDASGPAAASSAWSRWW